MFVNRLINGYKIPSVALYIIAVILIIVYGYVLRKMKMRDILADQIYHHHICQEIDGWSVIHLIFFGILGFLYPGHHFQFLMVGALWEVAETVIGQNQIELSGKRLQLIGDQDKDGNITGGDDAFWYGKESDIIVDACGYAIGSLLADWYWPNEYEKTHIVRV